MKVEKLLYRAAWNKTDTENIKEHNQRRERQLSDFNKYSHVHGVCYMVEFAHNDVRPMWEDQINPNELRELIRARDGLQYDCPLCQPYDSWEGRGRIDKVRTYLCRIIDPEYENGTIDEGGAYSKCACIAKGQRKSNLKFKRG